MWIISPYRESCHRENTSKQFPSAYNLSKNNSIGVQTKLMDSMTKHSHHQKPKYEIISEFTGHCLIVQAPTILLLNSTRPMT